MFKREAGIIWLGIFFFVFTFLIFNATSFVNADEYENTTLNISVYVHEPVARINVSPSSIYLGNVTKGYSTNFENITLTNLGDLDIRVQPVLSRDANSIFQNIKFASSSCSSWTPIGNWTSARIQRAENNQSPTRYNFCVKIDLTDYQEPISQNENLTTNVILWVMPS